MDKETLIKNMLEEYTLSDILERMDLTEEEVLEYLFDTGMIRWERVIAEIPMPVR